MSEYVRIVFLHVKKKKRTFRPLLSQPSRPTHLPFRMDESSSFWGALSRTWTGSQRSSAVWRMISWRLAIPEFLAKGFGNWELPVASGFPEWKRKMDTQKATPGQPLAPSTSSVD